MAFSMAVNGTNVLHWPFATVEEFAAKPAMSGVPFLGPWANRLDEQAFYANGKRYPFDMELGNVRGCDPDSRIPHDESELDVRRRQSRRRVAPGPRPASTSTSSRAG